MVAEIDMALQYMTKPSLQSRPLPELAFRTSILVNPNTARSVQRYAASLADEYPEQRSLIVDIADAAKSLSNQKDRAAIRRQLVNLERYLETSR